MQHSSDELSRGSVIGGYRIDELISRGGMGVIYRATNIALSRIYAVKVLAPELSDDDQFRQRFQREMRIAASLHHPNVVGIHYAGEHDGGLFLAMDFVYGTDLRELLHKNGALEPERAVDLLAQIASALDAAHAKGLVHRDVKPANVLITVRDGEEHAYLTDFGLAKRSDTIADLTQTGVVVGTVDYMAPEQVTGGVTDARTDIYALGCTFFHMLTGGVPYARDNTLATLYAHVNNPPPPVSGDLAELYPTFGAVIGKAMAKNLDDRYLSAGDFARDATAALSGMRYAGAATVVATGDAGLKHGGEDTSKRTGAAAEVKPSPLGSTVSQPTPDRAAVASSNEPTALRGGPPPERPPGTGPSGRRRSMRYRWPALAALGVIAGTLAAVIALTSSNSSNQLAGESFGAAVRPVPTNRVSGSGTATLVLQGNVATVTVETNGLPNAVHLMHIHGGTGNCPPSSAARTFAGHKFIDWSTGLNFYGQVVTSLTTHDETDPGYNLNASLYPVGGNFHYRRTITLAPGVAADILQGLGVIVVHGIDYNGNGIYDNFLGSQGELKAPALCGPLEPARIGATALERSGKFYTASLLPYSASAIDGAVSSLSLLCHVRGAPPNVPPRAPLRLT